MPLRAHRLTMAMLVGGAIFTAVTVFTPVVQFAYRGHELHLVLETAAALVALLAAYLFLGRFRQTRSPGDLLLVYALGLLGTTNIFFATVQALSMADETSDFAAWAPTATRAVAAAAFTLAALVHGRRLPDSSGAARFAVAACFATLTSITAVTAFLAPFLPTALDSSAPPVSASGPLLVGHPVLSLAQAASALLFMAAAIGFSRRARETADEFLHLLAAGSVLAALASTHYMLFPSLYSEWVYTGDVLRLGFYALLAVGAAGEIRRYWETRAQAAVLEERRRVARDLHDLLAQELALISRQSRRLLGRQDGELVGQLAAASERALAGSRRAIASLASSYDPPLGSALAEASRLAAERVGARVVVDVSDGFDLPPDMREELALIAAEAVTNAGHHGRASLVRVELTNGSGRRLRVRDNGVGFDPAEPAGYGITIMRDRARAIGGDLRLSSTPGRGTEVEVLLP